MRRITTHSGFSRSTSGGHFGNSMGLAAIIGVPNGPGESQNHSETHQASLTSKKGLSGPIFGVQRVRKEPEARAYPSVSVRGKCRLLRASRRTCSEGNPNRRIPQLGCFLRPSDLHRICIGVPKTLLVIIGAPFPRRQTRGGRLGGTFCVKRASPGKGVLHFGLWG